MMQGIAGEFQRQIGKIVSIGVVEAVEGNRVRVRIGRNFTPMIPFAAMRAGECKVYCPPSVGEEVVVFSPGGSLETAVAGPSLFNGENVAPAEGKGLVIEGYGCRVRIDAAGVSIEGESVKVVGDLSVEGDVAASGDVRAGGVSLKEHVHGGVEPGGGVTSSAIK